VVREPGPLLTPGRYALPGAPPHDEALRRGPDKPRSVGAICPNCHREIHHGAEGDEKNRRLQQRLAELEDGDPPAS